MNQYIITEEQLQGYEKTRNRLYDINGEHYVTGFAVKIQSHPYQSERDKVLDDLYRFAKENRCGWGFVDGVDAYRTELRQKAGEQCGDNCKGECSGEVTGTPFCPQPERDTVLERLHIWFENYCEGNEDPDLWVAFLHAERTLRQKCKEVGNIW